MAEKNNGVWGAMRAKEAERGLWGIWKTVSVSKAKRVRGSCERVTERSKEKFGGGCWKLMMVANNFFWLTESVSSLILFLNFSIISIFRIVN